MCSKPLSCFAFLFLLLTFLAIAVSFSCPEWLMYKVPIPGLRPFSKGLWLTCASPQSNNRYDNCDWLFANDFALQRNEPAWFLAVQILFSIALAVCALAVISGSCAAVCGKKCRGFSVTCGFLNLTFLLLVATVALFWAEAHVEIGVRPLDSPIVFGWCFWLALASAGTCLIATILYYFLSRRDYRARY